MSKIKYAGASLICKLMSNKIIVLASNFIFQGLRYMSLGEKIYKISITLLFAGVIYIYSLNLLASFLLGHTINYIVNGQFYVVYRYLSPKKVMSIGDLNKYLSFVFDQAEYFSPKDVLIIGSFCRGKMSGTSDLDVRIFHHSGFISSIKAYLMATKLRFYGLLFKFPIDVFCFSDLKFLDKIDSEEVPVHVFNDEAFMAKYPDSVHINEHLTKLTFE